MNLYLSPKQSISIALSWLCDVRQIPVSIIYVNDKKDLSDIANRNKENKLPALQHNDLLLLSISGITKYLVAFGINSTNWPGLCKKDDIVLSSKIDEAISYYDSYLSNTITQYLKNIQTCMYDGLPDTDLEKKLESILNELNDKKRRTRFMVSEEFNIIDLIYFATIYQLENTPMFKYLENYELFGWYRVCRKIIGKEWDTQDECLDSYDFQPTEENFVLAETIMEAVKNNRPDIIEKLAKDGYNINMPLAVVECVHRNNIFILKVMRDYDCFLKWPMAISQALKLSKCEDILSLLIDPNMSKDELIKEANEILKLEKDKMREVLGPEYEEYQKKVKESKKNEVEQVRNNSIIEGVHLTSRYVFFSGQKSPFSLEFLRVFKVDDIVYKSTLEYLLTQKAEFLSITDFSDRISDCQSMDDLVRLGNELQTDNEKWETEELEILKKANLAKFSQHKDLLHVLLQIGNKELVKTGKNDSYWGIGLETMNLDSQKKDKWLGKNRLGNHLMEIKDILSKDTPTPNK
jgi:hypothetical protein